MLALVSGSQEKNGGGYTSVRYQTRNYFINNLIGGEVSFDSSPETDAGASGMKADWSRHSASDSGSDINSRSDSDSDSDSRRSSKAEVGLVNKTSGVASAAGSRSGAVLVPGLETVLGGGVIGEEEYKFAARVVSVFDLVLTTGAN